MRKSRSRSPSYQDLSSDLQHAERLRTLNWFLIVTLWERSEDNSAAMLRSLERLSRKDSN